MFSEGKRRAFADAVKSIRIGVLGAILALAAGCNKKSDEKQSAGGSVPLVIGLSLADLKEERWQRDRDFFTAKAKSLGARVIVQDAGGDPNAQVRQCDGLLAKGVKVLVVVPKNADAARPIVLNAHAKGVKVISYDRLIGDADVDLYLSFDNEKVGEIQARAIAAAAPKGNYLLLRGDPADKNSDMIHAGHMKVLQPLIDKGDIKIAADQACDKWLRSEARRITADALQKSKIDAIVASNDGTASGRHFGAGRQEAGGQGAGLGTGRRPDRLPIRMAGPPDRNRIQAHPKAGRGCGRARRESGTGRGHR